MELDEAVVLAAALAMSSTAVVLRVLMDNAELDSRHGRTAVGILLAQDVAVVPLLLATLTLVTGTGGGPVGLLKDGIATSPTGFTMVGRPLIWCEQSSTVGDVGDLSLVDLNRYLLASKGGLQTAVSIHVRFLQDEQVIRFVYRVDGQPDLAAPITPYMGAAGVTVSPFVTLAAR